MYSLNQISKGDSSEFELDNPVYSVKICENGEKVMLAG